MHVVYGDSCDILRSSDMLTVTAIRSTQTACVSERGARTERLGSLRLGFIKIRASLGIILQSWTTSQRVSEEFERHRNSPEGRTPSLSTISSLSWSGSSEYDTEIERPVPKAIGNLCSLSKQADKIEQTHCAGCRGPVCGVCRLPRPNRRESDSSSR